MVEGETHTVGRLSKSKTRIENMVDEEYIA
jgi:hypothetical protein